MRFSTLLLAILPFTFTAAHAQTNRGAAPSPSTSTSSAASGNTPDDLTSNPEPESPNGALRTPSIDDPKFPLRIYLRVDHNRWVGDYMTYTGDGRFKFANTQQLYGFRYDCGYTFVPDKPFQARWTDDKHRKLQVLLDDPDHHTNHTCILLPSIPVSQ